MTIREYPNHPSVALADQETIDAMKKLSPEQRLDLLNTHMIQLCTMLTEMIRGQFPEWTELEVQAECTRRLRAGAS